MLLLLLTIEVNSMCGLPQVLPMKYYILVPTVFHAIAAHLWHGTRKITWFIKKATTDRLVAEVSICEDWPTLFDILHPPPSLKWPVMLNPIIPYHLPTTAATSIIGSQWREDCKLASIVNFI